MSATTTAPPSRAKASAVAAPMPPPPPISRQTLPLRAPTLLPAAAEGVDRHGLAPAQPHGGEVDGREQDQAVGDVDRGLAE